jgi:prophage regulatory protein
MHQTILRFPVIKSGLGLSRTTVHRRIIDGLFPRPVSLGGRAVGWPAHEIEAVKAARIAGQSDEEVRALVDRLHAARKVAA